jgi:hypothetical protein
MVRFLLMIYQHCVNLIQAMDEIIAHQLPYLTRHKLAAVAGR